MIGDFILDDIFDLKIENGDFVIKDSTAQHQQLLLLSGKGDWKQYPTVGVDVQLQLLDHHPHELMRQIRMEFTRDGMKIDKMKIDSSGKINIKANYNED